MPINTCNEKGAETPLKYKCKKDCIYYGLKWPCVFCIREKNNKDYYKKRETNDNSST